ncbi:hypothetical protein [Stenotrophomonas maltophilia]|uniref:Uncharacterized protein n=1 Tax=Stenotrophomonas maltophilia TaxID=40324 RepID=A0AAD0BUE3_STEMA|nr:hypothetical protein [Stenotrophomonas maltophilia]AUI07617.1 hypothetical protein SmaCSM2_10640 [Stenotrophomonas maltophilia]
MVDPLITFVLLAAIAAVSIGAARIVSWLLDRRDHAAVRRAKEAAIVAQARAELAATGWTPDHETLYQAEIAATKRGDLLAPANYAEQQEAANVR